jgi:hypothetical protein
MWRGEQSCPYRDVNSDPSAVQPVASRYTDCAVPASIAIGKLNRKIEMTVQAYKLSDVRPRNGILCDCMKGWKFYI